MTELPQPELGFEPGTLLTLNRNLDIELVVGPKCEQNTTANACLIFSEGITLVGEQTFFAKRIVQWRKS